MALRKEIRILGIDDSSFDKFKDKETLAIGVFFRGGNFLDGVVSTPVTVDGTNATAQLVRMVNRSKFKSQLRCIMLDGIALGGFNIVDVQTLSEETGIPVMVVVRDYPDFEGMQRAMKKLSFMDRWPLIEKAGMMQKINNIHVQLCNLPLGMAQEILKLSCIHSHVPEPIRVAHLIGQGIVYGESKGRA